MPKPTVTVQRLIVAWKSGDSKYAVSVPLDTAIELRKAGFDEASYSLVGPAGLVIGSAVEIEIAGTQKESTYQKAGVAKVAPSTILFAVSKAK